jgi:hypothetical protein
MPSVLTKLTFYDGRILLVHVKSFYVSFNNTRYFDLQGRSAYVESGHNDIKGEFTVDSVDNDLILVQSTLKSPFRAKPILEYGDQTYEIILTGINWRLDPLVSNGETFGHYLQYNCEFIAFPLNDFEEEPKNRVIWDSGCKNEFNDLSELVGENVQELASTAMKLIDKYVFFRAKVECPTPSYQEDATFADDVAAVIAGTKPAAVFEQSSLGKDDLLVFLLKEAQARGLKIETVDNFSKTKSIVVGDSYHVRQIVQIMNQAVKDNAVNDYYYEKLGDLIGLPVETIRNFNDNARDFGFNRA